MEEVVIRCVCYACQVFVPHSIKRDIHRSLLEDLTGRHLSRDKMLGKLRSKYFWLALDDDVRSYCRDCIECQMRKPPQVSPVSLMQPIECSRPFELVSMDVCGPYPISERNNKYILVITDHFTKWVEAYPMTNQEAITNYCHKQFVNTSGYPEIILTDQGRKLRKLVDKRDVRATKYRQTNNVGLSSPMQWPYRTV